MKDSRLDGSGIAMSAMVALLLLGTGPAEAQLHSKRTASGAVGTQSAIAESGERVAMIRRGELQNAAIVDTGYVDGTTLKYTDMRDPDYWARRIVHADDSYTESKKDLETTAPTMTQDTKSPNGVLLQRRLITFDARRKPAEVLIYDGRNQYRYRGVFLYDQAGRFVEEQLYDTNNQILRRRVQEYETNGSPKRIWVTDHARNIPEDLKLIITEEHDSEAAQRNYERFRREAREVKKNADRSETGKKKGFFGRILGGRK